MLKGMGIASMIISISCMSLMSLIMGYTYLFFLLVVVFRRSQRFRFLLRAFAFVRRFLFLTFQTAVDAPIMRRETDIIYIGWDALFDRRVQIQEYFPRYCATRSGKPELSIYDNKQEIYEKGLEFFYWQSRPFPRLQSLFP